MSEAGDRILCIRLSSIGDIVLTTYLYRMLRQQHPHLQIDVLVKSEFVELLEHDPHIHRLLPFVAGNGLAEIRRWRRHIAVTEYRWIADLHNNQRSWLMTFAQNRGLLPRFRKHRLRRWLLVKAKYRGKNSFSSVPERYFNVLRSLPLTDDGSANKLYWQESEAQRLARQYPQVNGAIALAPGAKHATKRWPVEAYAELAGRLYRDTHKAIILFGSAGESELAERLCTLQSDVPIVNLCGRLRLRESVALLATTRLLVANDSALMHIAGAVATPVVAIFGSTVEELGFFPFRSRSIVVENNALRCRPCSHIGRRRCPRRHFRCLGDIHVDQVFTACKEILASGRAA
jgi:lipopolysaccharide heptosyltransferase II